MVWDLLSDPVLLEQGRGVNKLEVRGHVHRSQEFKPPFVAVALWSGRCMGLLLVADISPFPQYSQKEDKYEEEIKILTDKLKEVSDRVGTASDRWEHPQAVASVAPCTPKLLLTDSLLSGRRRPVLNSPSGLWPSWRRPSMIWKVCAGDGEPKTLW